MLSSRICDPTAGAFDTHQRVFVEQNAIIAKKA
jgi:hypothetical protein